MTKSCPKSFSLFLSIFILSLFQQSPARDHVEGKIIKEIQLHGLRWTQEFIVHREFDALIGAPYSARTVRHHIEELLRMGTFSSIEHSAAQEGNEVIITLHIDEIYPYLPTIAMSITDEDGILVGGGFKSVNLFGRAYNFSAKVLVGQSRNIEILFKNPWVTGNHFGFDTRYYNRIRWNKIYEFNENSNELFLRAQNRMGTHGHIGVSLAFQAIRSDRAGKTLSADNHDKVAELGAYLQYDTIDSRINPTQGWWNEIELTKSGILNSDGNFWRATIDVRHVRPIADKHVLAVTSLTTLMTGTVGQNIAPWQQYAFGGTNSIRGWMLAQHIGKNQFINTIEYRYNFFEPRTLSIWGFSFYLGLQVAAFADFGHVWNESNEFRLRNFTGGYGVGFRALLPYVGIVRLDMAMGQPSIGMSFHIGGNEKSNRQRLRVR